MRGKPTAHVPLTLQGPQRLAVTTLRLGFEDMRQQLGQHLVDLVLPALQQATRLVGQQTGWNTIDQRPQIVGGALGKRAALKRAAPSS